MKKYTKNWLLAFTVTVLVCVSLTLALLLYMRPASAKTPAAPAKEQPQKPAPFVDIEDNVGAVSLTEDEVTELARSAFSDEGFLTDVAVELEDDGVALSARIKNKDALVSRYPELEKYSLLLSALEGRKITVTGGLAERDGLAAFEISEVTVAGLPVDKRLLSPFIEDDGFADFFGVPFDSVELKKGRLVFYGDLPEIFN